MVLLLLQKKEKHWASSSEKAQYNEKFLRSIGISDNLLIETELIEHNLSVDTLRSMMS